MWSNVVLPEPERPETQRKLEGSSFIVTPVRTRTRPSPAGPGYDIDTLTSSMSGSVASWDVASWDGMLTCGEGSAMFELSQSPRSG